MSDTKSFELSGGWLCLDFCNTADGDINHDWNELLASYEDLVAFGRQTGILSPERARYLIEQAALRPGEADDTLKHARSLRYTIYQVFAAVAHSHTPDLNDFNRELLNVGGRLCVVPRDGGFTWGWVNNEALESVLWPIVWSAGALLVSEQLDRVRECGGENCTWLFVDTSRNHSRRWCDMKGCGNRAKARRHYQRTKST